MKRCRQRRNSRAVKSTRAVEEAGPRALAAIRERAEEDKVFGVPMFFVRGEPFWGNDRIDWVRKRLDELELRKR